MNILGSRIKKEREKLGLTREELGNKIGVSYSAIAMYERGEREPNNALTAKMCDLFNCTMDYLMGLTSYQNPKQDLERKLYELNLSENEFNTMISLLLDENNDNLDILFSKDDSKLTKACKECLELAWDYTTPIDEDLTEDQKKQIESLSCQNINKVINIIMSLDKSKIIHNYNDPNIARVSPDIRFYMCPVYGQISAGQPNWAEECIEGRLPLDPDLMGIVNPEEHFFLRVNGESMNKIIGNGAFALIHKQDIVDDGEIAVVLVNGYDATLKKFTRQGDMIILEPQSNDDSFKTQVYDKTTPIKILGKYVGKMEINK